MIVKVSRKNVGIQGSLSTEENIHLITKKSCILAQYCKGTILEVQNKFAENILVLSLYWATNPLKAILPDSYYVYFIIVPRGQEIQYMKHSE